MTLGLLDDGTAFHRARMLSAIPASCRHVRVFCARIARTPSEQIRALRLCRLSVCRQCLMKSFIRQGASDFWKKILLYYVKCVE